MKNLVLAAIVISLAGCAVSLPSPSKNVIAYAPVITTTQVVYYWDPVQIRYFWIDDRNSRHYMPYDWKHPHGHKPLGYDHWDKR